VVGRYDSLSDHQNLIPYAAENVVYLFAGNQLDIPRTVPRKPPQPQELHSAHFLTFGVHDYTCAAQRICSGKALSMQRDRSRAVA
jgi:hypothetical protein